MRKHVLPPPTRRPIYTTATVFSVAYNRENERKTADAQPWQTYRQPIYE
jgi:hypothetical protein